MIITLPATIEVRGKVVSHGRGVAGFRVEATTPSNSCKTTSDQGGTFSCVVESDGGPVNYRVMDHQGEVVGTARGAVGETVEIEVETWVLSGSVSAAEGGPFNVSTDAFVAGHRAPTPLGMATDPTTGRFELSGLAMGASYWLTVRSMSGNSVSEGPFSNGDYATLKLLELARLEFTAPCPGEHGEMRNARSESSLIPLRAIPIRVSSDGEIEAVELPAGEWYVELRVGAGGPVSATVTLEAGATQTLSFESCS